MPYGTRLAADGKTLEAHPDEARILADVRALRANGSTFRAIAKFLDGLRVPTRTGKPWSHSTVAKLAGRAVAP